MKLEKYLADYIDHELGDNNDLTMQEIVRDGIEAFESTEDVKISIKAIPEQCLDCPDRANCDGWDEKDETELS